MRHNVDWFKVSAFIDGAGGGRDAHPGDWGQTHHLGGDLPVPVQDVDIETRQDDSVVPVQRVTVAGEILFCLPLK